MIPRNPCELKSTTKKQGFAMSGLQLSMSLGTFQVLVHMKGLNYHNCEENKTSLDCSLACGPHNTVNKCCQLCSGASPYCDMFGEKKK